MRGKTRLSSITTSPIISLSNRQIIRKKRHKKELQKRASSMSLNSVGFQAIALATLMSATRVEADPYVDKNVIAFCNLIKGFFRINKGHSHN